MIYDRGDIRYFDDVDRAVFRKLFRNANFDPITATALIGAGVTAAGTLAGGANAAATGSMQNQVAQYEAGQERTNAGADTAAAQRRASDIMLGANLKASTSRANAAANGVNASTGSALDNEAGIQTRGRYASALALFNGENKATSDLNQAAAQEATGQIEQAGGKMQQDASYLTAAGTLAGSGANAFKTYADLHGMTSPNGVPSLSFLTQPFNPAGV